MPPMSSVPGPPCPLRVAGFRRRLPASRGGRRPGDLGSLAILALSLALLVAAGSCPPAASASPLQPSSDASNAEILDQLRSQIEPLKRQLEQWRGLEFLTPVEMELAASAPQGMAGWYEPDTDKLVVVARAGERFRRGVLLHELFHALQDQHFDLEALRERVGDDRDAQRAVSALIEGEAMLAVSEILDYDFSRHARFPPEGEVPEAMVDNVFHYGAGMDFVRTVRSEGGFEAVAALYADPPTTTAEILAPGRRLRAEALRALEAPVEGRVADDGRAGAFGVYRALVEATETRPRARELATLVVADRLRRVTQREGGGEETTAHEVWDLVLDGPEAAERFLHQAGRGLESLGWEVHQAGSRVRLVR